MNYVIAAYGVTVLALGWYGLRLHLTRRELARDRRPNRG